MSRAALAAAALFLVPIPVGVGPRYHPAPGATGACASAPLDGGGRAHIELFAGGRVVIVPAGIGVRGARSTFGRITAARCRGAIWTSDPTGVVHFDGSPTLRELFRVWGRPFGANRLLAFRGHVRLYRTGRPVAGDPRDLRLRDRDQVVLEVGRYVAPHRSYRFPP